MGYLRSMSQVLAAAVLLCTLVEQSACETGVDKSELSLVAAAAERRSAEQGVTSAPDNEQWATVPALPADQLTVTAVARARAADDDDDDDDSEFRQHGNKIKKKPKLKKKKSKKILKKILPLLLIPLLIQAKLIPLFLFKLKLLALKAFGIGKLALILIIINVVYNAMHGAQNVDQQYSKEVLANEHYGYTGSPEYGAWVNKRLYNVQAP